jgi:hypothetical protein
VYEGHFEGHWDDALQSEDIEKAIERQYEGFVALHYALLRGAFPPKPSILPFYCLFNVFRLKGIVPMPFKMPFIH